MVVVLRTKQISKSAYSRGRRLLTNSNNNSSNNNSTSYKVD